MQRLEPLNQDFDELRARQAVAAALDEFYQRLSEKLRDINLREILKKKNPYLYRAKGISNAAQIVDGILAAYLSSSEETIFGNVFFEPLAIAVSGGQKAVTEGMDITVDRDNVIYSIAVKSGISVFNGDSRKRQEQNFQSAAKRVQQARKAYIPVVGYGYGTKRIRPGKEKFYWELAGQEFWAWLTGDPDFYLKIVQYMGPTPEEYAQRFDEIYNGAENRLLREFTMEYCDAQGFIDWDKLVRFNSGAGW